MRDQHIWRNEFNMSRINFLVGTFLFEGDICSRTTRVAHRWSLCCRRRPTAWSCGNWDATVTRRTSWWKTCQAGSQALGSANLCTKLTRIWKSGFFRPISKCTHTTRNETCTSRCFSVTRYFKDLLTIDHSISCILFLSLPLLLHSSLFVFLLVEWEIRRKEKDRLWYNAWKLKFYRL